MAQTITRIRDANEFMTAFSVKQRIEACFGIAIKRALPTAGIGRPGTTTVGGKQTYDGKTLSPGMMLEMNPGDEIQNINPQGQSTDASAYVKLMLRMIGAGQGLSYEATSRDMSQCTYSSARQGLIEDGMTYAEKMNCWRKFWMRSMKPSSFRRFWPGRFPSRTSGTERMSISVIPSRNRQRTGSTPAKEATATKIALMTGQKTFKQIAAENGADWRKQS